MKKTLADDRKYLLWNNQRGIAWIMSRGYQWFTDRYLPAVSRLEQAGLRKDHFLLSYCYYEIGDVHDFNRCPMVAITAYKKSFELDDLHAEALRELGGMYENIGQYGKAASILKKSLKINPDDEFTVIQQNFVLNSIKFGSTPFFKKDDLCWKAREYLAVNKPKAALRVLKNKRSISTRQTMAQAYGLLGDIEGIVDQWQHIGKAKGMIEMTYADWFYIDDHVENNAEFWEIIAGCARANRFKYSVWSIFNSLYETVVKFPTQRKSNKADITRCNKCVFLMAQYNIAFIRRDRALAEKVFARYPNWPEMEELLEKLKKNQKKKNLMPSAGS